MQGSAAARLGRSPEQADAYRMLLSHIRFSHGYPRPSKYGMNFCPSFTVDTPLSVCATSIYVHIYIYAYIHGWMERERERDRDFFIGLLALRGQLD